MEPFDTWHMFANFRSNLQMVKNKCLHKLITDKYTNNEKGETKYMLSMLKVTWSLEPW